MKNRLEAARELLRNDGVIFVQCDDNEQAYLKVLMDEIFGRENFESSITHIVKPEWRMYGNIAKTHEYILVYSKDLSINTFNEVDKKEYLDNKDEGEIFQYFDEKGWYNLRDLRNWAISFFNSENRPNLRYPFYVDQEMNIYLEPTNGTMEVWAKWNSVWTWWKEKCKSNISELVAKKGTDDVVRIYRKMRSTTTKFKSLIYSKEYVTVQGTNQMKKLGFDFSNPKPEALLERIITIATNPWDIVLDYHLGSGTTAAVAHKMGRRWIGVEQMDYIDTIAKERLKKVIAGEQGGISKNMNWQGGGDFVYLELKTFNGYFLDEIEKATSKETLKKIYNDMKRSAFLKFFFDPDDFENEESENGKKYAQLTLAEQKEKLKGVLDMNHIYLNAGNYDETVHTISELDKSLTAKFYGEK